MLLQVVSAPSSLKKILVLSIVMGFTMGSYFLPRVKVSFEKLFAVKGKQPET